MNSAATKKSASNCKCDAPCEWGTKIRPLGDKIIVKRSEAPTTKGGIILPDTAQEKPKEGTIIAVGPGKRNKDGSLQPMDVKKCDKVLFSAYAGTEITDGDETFLIMSQSDVLGIISE